MSFDSLGLDYSEALLSAELYFQNSPDAFVGDDIDDTYLDGMSWTYGSPRNHLFSMAISTGYGDSDCPDDGGVAAPSFVGTDYSCVDGGDRTSSWVGPDQTGESFVVALGSPSSDDIEGRLLSVQDAGDEDVGIGSLRLGVR